MSAQVGNTYLSDREVKARTPLQYKCVGGVFFVLFRNEIFKFAVSQGVDIV